jgi:AbrB family looped-hinge helix DNA binding protein
MSTCRVDNQGRIVIPSKWRREHHVHGGSELVLLEEKGRLILQTRQQAIREAQDIVRAAIPHQGSLVARLLRDRRAEVERERRDSAAPRRRRG